MKKGRTKATAILLAVTLLGTMLLGGCGAKKEESDTIKWINASYAILTELNGQDYTMFGGMRTTSSNKQMVSASLRQSWDVTDRQTAEETLEWALTEGHRTGFAEMGQYIEEIGLEDLAEEEWNAAMQYMFEVDETEAQYFIDMYKMYKEYGASAIDAWDYCRALNLLSFYYIAGYYTEEEALDASLEIAKEFQSMYSSWDEMIDSYLRGYEYWAEESSDERRAVYEDLQSRSDNPYAVDYNTVLEKTW